MARYPVRCCCSPDIVFGHLELVDGLRADDRVPVMKKVKFGPGADGVTFRYEQIRVRRYIDRSRGIDEIAVYSDDHPIEFWRKLRGFTELVAGTGVEPASPAL